MTDQPSGFLARWNLRRQKVQQEEQAEATAELTDESVQVVDAADVAPESDTSVTETPEDRVLTAADLPDPEKIEVGGSFASFMADNVDPAAKTAALRALWKQPHYNEIDGLLEYALDYTNQPKLSSEASAELAKKVFRHIIKDEDKEQVEAEEMTAATEQDIDNSDNAITADNLDAESIELTQNEPDPQATPKPPVV
ncbi:DUF3306 domain-containing protein [Shewanella sp. Isolate11]|uniref:DUF3306 domain-containing protein n=1 Tax=Shewanella sp. Isolate11 TaxID=2908530 RepID=UPI001EFDCE7C|nr:DUF3306 domain-containing protein [Shewanella sp. Isolate11]MCG9698086.1 DUF3306 domain-containing protein [Shewanella sp. Isolate11]